MQIIYYTYSCLLTPWGWLCGIVMAFAMACSPATSKPKSDNQHPIAQVAILEPKRMEIVHPGQTLALRFAPKGLAIDSTVVSLNQQYLATIHDTVAQLPIAPLQYGSTTLLLQHYAHGQQVAASSQPLQCLPATAPKRYTYKVIKEYLHDSQAYTQGLQWHEGVLLESTGLYGQSDVRKVELATGRVIERTALPAQCFGEGLCILQGLVYQLTWREGKGFVYGAQQLDQLATFSYAGEGWGLATDGQQLIMSNGSHVLQYLSAKDFATIRTLEVYTHQGKVTQLNELEVIGAELWANVYQTDEIVRIDTATGQVVGIVNLAGLLPKSLRTAHTDVLNGIAYDAALNRIYVTGKNWSRLYQIQVVPEQ